jgi:hypothetical protein
MSKFNRAAKVNRGPKLTHREWSTQVSPVITQPVATGVTFEGAPGYARDLKSELFLLAVSNLTGEDTFYERAGQRDERYRALARQAAVEDPAWTARFIGWLRDAAGMRSASIVAAAEFVKGRLDAGARAVTGADGTPIPGGKRVVASALRRADEPGELIGYWRSAYGRRMPIALKRGIATAVHELYGEFALLKYDSRDAAVRFGDVVELVNPRYHNRSHGTWRDALYRYAIERRHGRGNDIPAELAMIRANAELRARAATDFAVLLDAGALAAAGMTWEDALSLAGTSPAGARVAKGDLWSALIPSMGYFALLRNLRNLDEAGVPDEVAEQVARRLADPAQVARSRLFPMRFLAAYQAVPSLRWAYPLERALQASLGNVPRLAGRTLVLVDRSGSMFGPVSKMSQLTNADAAAIFGTVLAQRSEQADLVEFGTFSQPVRFAADESALTVLKRFTGLGGTNTAEAIRRHYRRGYHTRVILVTDEQASWRAGADPLLAVPPDIPVYTWNLAGYRLGHGESGLGSRHTFGGLSDKAFRLIPLLEAGRDARWDDLFGQAA